MRKKHENPEFQVINMEQANAKFYAASEVHTGDTAASYDNATDGVGGSNDIWD